MAAPEGILIQAAQDMLWQLETKLPETLVPVYQALDEALVTMEELAEMDPPVDHEAFCSRVAGFKALFTEALLPKLADAAQSLVTERIYYSTTQGYAEAIEQRADSESPCDDGFLSTCTLSAALVLIDTVATLTVAVNMNPEG